MESNARPSKTQSTLAYLTNGKLRIRPKNCVSFSCAILTTTQVLQGNNILLKKAFLRVAILSTGSIIKLNSMHGNLTLESNFKLMRSRQRRKLQGLGPPSIGRIINWIPRQEREKKSQPIKEQVR